MHPSLPATIELRHLRYFLAVSEELHFGRAAARLYLTQPPLSAAIRKLEAAVGVRLLDRTKRAVTLTQAGRVFADEARKTLAALDLGVEETRRAGGARTALRVGCVPALSAELLLGFVRALHEGIPELEVQVEHHHTLEQLKRLRSGALDLAIVLDPEDHSDLEIEWLFAGEALAAYMPPSHRLAAQAVVRPDDVRTEFLVTGPRSTNPAVYERVLAQFGAADYRFQGIHEAGGATARDLFVAVASGLGITFAPRSLAEMGDVGHVLVRRTLDPPLAMPATVLAWKADAPPRLRTVLATVREIAREVAALERGGGR